MVASREEMLARPNRPFVLALINQGNENRVPYVLTSKKTPPGPGQQPSVSRSAVVRNEKYLSLSASRHAKYFIACQIKFMAGPGIRKALAGYCSCTSSSQPRYLRNVEVDPLVQMK